MRNASPIHTASHKGRQGRGARRDLSPEERPHEAEDKVASFSLGRGIVVLSWSEFVHACAVRIWEAKASMVVCVREKWIKLNYFMISPNSYP